MREASSDQAPDLSAETAESGGLAPRQELGETDRLAERGSEGENVQIDAGRAQDGVHLRGGADPGSKLDHERPVRPEPDPGRRRPFADPKRSSRSGRELRCLGRPAQRVELAVEAERLDGHLRTVAEPAVLGDVVLCEAFALPKPRTRNRG